ncbi:MAG: PqqD family peptide modification chaperone [Phycisphaerae bacterium]
MAELRPRLRPTVQAHRQYFRGQMWHVLQDPASNQFFRLNDAAYRFVSLLDGHRTVAEAWKICNEQLGDQAPTQGEAIQLLGQLYTSNLLRAELPPDAEGLLKRHSKRVRREVQSYLMNLLFMRFPLYDPNRFLNRWVGVFGKVFTWYGFVVWLAVMFAGFYALAGRWGELIASARNVLDPETLPLLYLAFLIVKLFHEFGHAFACKRFGQINGSGGEVHTMGIMLLVLTPMPYVDASSAWAFRRKWHRVLVGASGMYVELAVAAVAAMIWAQAEGSPTVQALTYRVMLVASVSSLLFNGNPLLRFDGYYILSDITEIPNLSQRSKQYVYYVVKRYLWGMKKVRNPAHSRGERIWFGFYGVASTIYRVFICTAILWRIASNEKLFIFAAVLAASAVVAWIVVPLGKFLHYLLLSTEVARQRGRAIATTAILLAIVVVGVGVIPFPDHYRVEGIIEPDGMRYVHAGESGFLATFAPTGTKVRQGDVIFRLENTELTTSLATQKLELQKLLLEQQEVRRRKGLAAAQMYEQRIAAKRQRIAWLQKQVAALEMRSPISGQWIAPDIEAAQGAFLEHGERLGFVAELGDLQVHAGASQNVPLRDIYSEVEIRVKGRPDLELRGTIAERNPAGTDRLPSPAMSYLAGGSFETDPSDKEGTRTLERFFRLMIRPDDANVPLLPGQVVVVRVTAPPKPLAVQVYRKVLQLVQKKFRSS